MSSLSQPTAGTRMLARVLGPYLTIVTMTAVARASQMPTLLAEFDKNPVWPWVSGAFILLIGLTVIALHQHWRGAAAVVVSVLGWVTALKGLFLLAFPHTYIAMAADALGGAAWWRAGFVAIAICGLYLSHIGWAPGPSRPVSRAAPASADLPRAA